MMSQPAVPQAAPDSPTESLIEYPCPFPIKVMGARHDDFLAAMIALAREFDPAFDAALIEMRESSGGRYQSVTLTITATSREQLDSFYRALTGHPLVKVVL